MRASSHVLVDWVEINGIKRDREEETYPFIVSPCTSTIRPQDVVELTHWAGIVRSKLVWMHATNDMSEQI